MIPNVLRKKVALFQTIMLFDFRAAKNLALNLYAPYGVKQALRFDIILNTQDSVANNVGFISVLLHFSDIMSAERGYSYKPMLIAFTAFFCLVIDDSVKSALVSAQRFAQGLIDKITAVGIVAVVHQNVDIG